MKQFLCCFHLQENLWTVCCVPNYTEYQWSTRHCSFSQTAFINLYFCRSIIILIICINFKYETRKMYNQSHIWIIYLVFHLSTYFCSVDLSVAWQSSKVKEKSSQKLFAATFSTAHTVNYLSSSSTCSVYCGSSPDQFHCCCCCCCCCYHN